MRHLFTLVFLLGLGLGVASMFTGIDRRLQRRGRAGVFNLPTMAAFFTLAGAVGYLVARYSLLPFWAVTLFAALAGMAGATAAVIMIVGWAVPSAARDVEDERYLLQGHLGVVTRAIGGGPPGEIRYEHEGVPHTVPAQSLDGQPIAVGTEVVIERVEFGVAHVETWSSIARQLELPA